MDPVSGGYMNSLNLFSNLSKTEIHNILTRNNISNARNLALVEDHSNLDGLLTISQFLVKAGLLNEAKFQLAAKHPHVNHLTEAAWKMLIEKMSHEDLKARIQKHTSRTPILRRSL